MMVSDPLKSYSEENVSKLFQRMNQTMKVMMKGTFSLHYQWAIFFYKISINQVISLDTLPF